MWLGKGLLFGFGISLLIGPIFFFMLEAGIKYGFKRAIHFALGTWISDIIFIISTYLAFSKIQDLIKNPETLNTIKLSVGVILICIGIFSFLYNAKVKKQTSSKKIIASKLLTKGFFIKRLSGKRYDGYSAPVEISGCHNDFSLVFGNTFDGIAPFAGNLDGGFNGFRSAVHGQAHLIASHVR